MAIRQLDVVEEDVSLVARLAELSWVDEEAPEPARAEPTADPREGFAMDALLIW